MLFSVDSTVFPEVVVVADTVALQSAAVVVLEVEVEEVEPEDSEESVLFITIHSMMNLPILR